ncbi:hypothetical protein ACTXT7_002951 [Hymenolepis weldensis]
MSSQPNSNQISKVVSPAKYCRLLIVTEEMRRDSKKTCACDKNAAERLKNNIQNARILVRDCLEELNKFRKVERGEAFL